MELGASYLLSSSAFQSSIGASAMSVVFGPCYRRGLSLRLSSDTRRRWYSRKAVRSRQARRLRSTENLKWASSETGLGVTYGRFRRLKLHTRMRDEGRRSTEGPLGSRILVNSQNGKCEHKAGVKFWLRCEDKTTSHGERANKQPKTSAATDHQLKIMRSHVSLQCKLRISIHSVEAISMLIDSYSYAKIKYYYVNCYKKTLTYAIDIAQPQDSQLEYKGWAKWSDMTLTYLCFQITYGLCSVSE